jgi:AAA15 family ATPase/GTPase
MKEVYLKSLSFSGIKTFKDKVEIIFKADSSISNRSALLRNFSTNFEGNLKFNPVIGMTGPNGSGKTTVGDVLYIYREYLRRGANIFNQKDINLSDESDFPLKKDLFNTMSNTIEIEVVLETFDKEIFHCLSINIDSTFEESISIRKKINTKNSKYNIYKKTKDSSVDLKTYEAYMGVEKAKNVKLKENDIETLEVINVISRFANSLVLKSAFSVNSSAGFIERFFIDDNVKLSLEEKRQIFSDVVKSFDSNVTKVFVDKISSMNGYGYSFKFELHEKKIVSMESLSMGTYKAISTIMQLIYISNLEKWKQKYLFFDEIDNSWHPNLTRLFITMFSKGPLFDWTLICTFHNPYISNEFRKDALYLISEDKKILSWNKYINEHNKKYPLNPLRYDNDFSSKYLDEIICSGPENINFSTIEKQFNYDE